MSPQFPSPRLRGEGQGGGSPLLESRGLCVDYGFGEDAVHAVSDCDLTLHRGQVLGLAGESGSGKSTLAMAAIRLLRSPAVITNGQVLFHPSTSHPSTSHPSPSHPSTSHPSPSP